MSSLASAQPRLKTVSGRSCAVNPPFTLERLITAAVDELQVDRTTLKLYLKGRLLCAAASLPSDDSTTAKDEIDVPDNAVILVVGKPMKAVEKREAKRSLVSAATKEVVADSPKAVNIASQKTSEVRTAPFKSEFDDDESCLRIYTGFKRKGLYFYMRSCVFLHGWHGLHELVRRRDPNVFRIFRHFPTVVSIVEYVDRCPARLKEVLISIKEDDPWLFRWIENNAEFFLDVINTPPSGKDESSPKWFIRQAKEAYTSQTSLVGPTAVQSNARSSRDSTRCLSKSLTSLSHEGGNASISSSKKGNERRLQKTSAPSSLESDEGNPAGSKDVWKRMHRENPLYTEVAHEDTLRRVAMKKWNATAESEKHPILEETVTQLRQTTSVFLQTISRFLFLDTEKISMLNVFVQVAKNSFEEMESWLVQQECINAAFETSLGRQLFEFAAERIATPTDSSLPPNDPTLRWITLDGPSTLAKELQEYSLRETCTLVMYSTLSPPRAFAYVVKGYGIGVAPILLDETADQEMHDLRRVCAVLARPPTARKAHTLRKTLQQPWATLMTRLYARLITPLEAMLPPPARKASDHPASVQQLCFISPWAAPALGVPFHALRQPLSGRPCALQWAPFVASRAWHLLVARAVPWSSPAVSSPAVTRVALPVAAWPADRRESTAPNPTAGAVQTTSVHTVGDGRRRLRRVPWDDVPLPAWLRGALRGAHMALPATKNTAGGATETAGGRTALLIHEASGGAGGAGGAACHGPADLFVSDVFGRASGVGVHRAALIPLFHVAGRPLADWTHTFFRGLVATGDMTAAKAFRLALLTSWKGECKEEPWRSASLALFNYGGPMRTLSTLHGRQLRQWQSKAGRPSSAAQETRNGTQAKVRTPYRETPEGRYIEAHAIDAIYEVLLQDLTAQQPIGEVAILDSLIHSLETNRTKLEGFVEARQKAARGNGPAAPPVATKKEIGTHHTPSNGMAAGGQRERGSVSKFVSAKRNMVHLGNCTAPEKQSSKGGLQENTRDSCNNPK